MAIRTELSLQLTNSAGALAAVCRFLSEQRINVVAMSLESSGKLHLVVDNHVGAGGALRQHHYQVAERDVLVTSLSHGPGAIQPLLQRIGDAGVHVEYFYGAAAESSDIAIAVIAVDQPMRASAAAGI